MQITLTAHGEQLLREYLARGRARSPEELIEQALEVFAFAERKEEADLNAFEAALDQLAAHSAEMPILPSEAFGREGIYEDRR